MAEFLTTSGTSHYIEQIIIDAKDKLFLVSPYLKLSKTLYERLKDASMRKVPITIVYGKDELNNAQWSSLNDLPTIRVLYMDNLHAKCYFNEKQMVITSMNMYEFSEKNNREMGLLIHADSDPSIYAKAVTETNSIIQAAKLKTGGTRNSNFIVEEKPKNYYQNNSNNQNSIPKNGYCIRCETSISFDTEKPLCYKCYNKWAEYSNFDYMENVCHCCGNDNDVSFDRPVCYSCFKKLEKAGYVV